MQNDQLWKELISSHTLSYIEDDYFHMEDDIVEVMKEPHVEDKQDESSDSQVLVKGDAIEYLGQKIELMQQYIQ